MNYPKSSITKVSGRIRINKGLSVILAVVALSLSACATQTTVSSEEEFGATMAQTESQVSSLLEAGKKDEAIRILNELSRANPERKEPWVRIAKLYFDDARYSQAIVSAEEVLQRDRTDKTAKSIRAVSGLRVASQSLNDLRSDVSLQGNARPDATGLAMVMREILGEDVLVPPAELEARKKREIAAKRAAPTPRTRQAPAGKAAPSKPAAGNPFSVLK